MEVHQIRYFLAACDTLNFSRASEACEVSVASLTRSIHKLEEELGGQLFRRERHVTMLTDLGRLMRVHLASARVAMEAAAADARKYQALRDVRLRLGLFSTMPANHLVSLLKALNADAPELELDLWEAACAELSEALVNGEIDIAIMSWPDYGERLRPETLYEEPYDVAFAPGHRFEAMDAVPLSELRDERYVKRLNCEFPSDLQSKGGSFPFGSLRIKYMTEREDWAQSIVAGGLGCSLMPRYLPILDGILTRPVVNPEVVRRISVVTVAGRRHSTPVATALRVIKSVAWQKANRPGRVPGASLAQAD